MRIDLYEQGGYSGGGITENGGNISGPLVLAGNPSQTLEAVPKQYVDAFFYSLNASAFVAGTVNPARLPAFTGDISKAEGSATFNLNNSGVVAGSYGKVTVNAKGIVTAGSQLSDNDIPSGIDWTKINAGSLPNTMSGYGIVDGVSVSGATLTGFLTLTQSPIQGTHTVSKQYVDGLVTSGGISVGDILRKPYSATPSGFLKCNGAEVDKATYSALYSVIGDSFSNALTPGSGTPWNQQYQINSHSGDVSPWVTETQGLYAAAYYTSVVVTKNRVYLLGCWSGGYSAACYTAFINADGTLNPWTTAPSLPQVQAISNVFVTKNRVYLCGGYTNNSSSTTSCWTAVINSDGTLGAWASAPALPSGMGWGATFITKNRVYIVGGANGSAGTTLVYTATINSDGMINNWSPAAPFPVAISSGSWFVTKNRVYMVGGSIAGVSSNAVYTAPISADGTLGSWTLNSKHLPEAIAGMQFFATKNTAYVLGGYNSSVALNRIYYAPINPDGTLGEWVASPNTLPQQYWGGETFVTKNKVYICAGQIGGGGTLNATVMSASLNGGLNDYSTYFSEDTTNYMLSGSGAPWQQQYQANTTQSSDITGWSVAGTFPAAISYASHIVTKNRVYIIGGSIGSVGNKIYYAPINADGTLGTWVLDTNTLPFNCGGATAVITKNKVYLVNPWVDSTPSAGTWYATINADGSLGSTWTAGTSLPSALPYGRTHITKNKIYIIGGWSGYSAFSTVYRANIDSNGVIGAWEASSSLPTAQGYTMSFITKNRIYVCGGYNGSAYTTVVYTASINSDGYLGPWTVGPSLPGTMGTAEVFVTKNKVYLLGGTPNGPSPHAVVYIGTIGNDGVVTGWTTGTSLPASIGHSNCFAVKNKLYLFCGWSGSSTFTQNIYSANISSDISDYSPYYDGTVIGQDTSINYLMPGSGKPWQQQYQINMTQNGDITGWSANGSLPTPVQSGHALVTKNRIYICGGFNGSSHTSTVYTAIINEDGTLGPWTTGASLPGPTTHGQLIVTKNRAYLLGGYNGSSYISTVYTAPINADGTIGTWVTGTPLPEALGYSQAVVTKNRVYLLGGNNPSGSSVATVYTAIINSDGTIGSWSTGASLPNGFSRSTAVVTKNRIYLCGGYNGSTHTSTVYTAAIDTDGVIGNWSITTSLPGTFDYSQSFVTSNRVYLLGGYNGSTHTSTVYTAIINEDGTLGPWTTGTSLISVLDESNCIVVNNKIYLIAGYNNTSPTGNIYSATITSGVQDYSPYYDGTVTPTVIPVANDKFLLPDFSDDEPFGSYSYIKY